METTLIRKLLSDLNGYVRSRYGKPRDLIIEILITQCSIKLLLAFFKYIIKEAENAPSPIEDIDNIEEKKPIRHQNLQNLKTKLKKKLLIRGGDNIKPVIELIKFAKELLETYGPTAGLLNVFVKLIRPNDLSPSVYDRYHRTFLIQSESDFVCENAAYAYLNKIFSDEKVNNMSWQDKRDQIYNILFKPGKLSSIKGKRSLMFIQLLFTCGILFTVKADGQTLLALMEALKKALREGTISRAVARRFFRRLQKMGVPVSPELDQMLKEMIEAAS
jgi:hypothetical protein